MARKRNFDLNVVDTASALALSFGALGAIPSAGASNNVLDEWKAGNWTMGFRDLALNLTEKPVQRYLAKVALGTIAAKGAARLLKVRKLGGIKNVFSLTV